MFLISQKYFVSYKMSGSGLFQITWLYEVQHIVTGTLHYARYLLGTEMEK